MLFNLWVTQTLMDFYPDRMCTIKDGGDESKEDFPILGSTSGKGNV